MADEPIAVGSAATSGQMAQMDVVRDGPRKDLDISSRLSDSAERQSSPGRRWWTPNPVTGWTAAPVERLVRWLHVDARTTRDE